MSQVIETVVGPARVLHRLAVAVECRDALSDRLIDDATLLAQVRRAPTAAVPDPVWHPLTRHGTARFTLEHTFTGTAPLPDLEILVEDPSRRHVPRRFTITPWQLAEVSEPAPYVAARSRLLRVWLLPGSAAPLPPTTTRIRGRIVQGRDRPRRWARVRASTPSGEAGWAHADERGEFVLAIADAGHDLTRDTRDSITVTLQVLAPATLPDPLPPAAHRTDDLVSEIVGRSINPPADSDLDNDMLRGEVGPPGYVANAGVPPDVDLEIGRETSLSSPIDFIPPP